jgi:flagellin-like protein
MDHRGVSSVVGVALMLVIVLLLAVIIGSMALGVAEDLPTPGPQVSLSVAEYEPDGDGNGGKPYLEIHHQAGDIADGTKVFVVDGDGNRVAWTDIWTTGPKVGPGSAAHVDGCGSDGALNRISEEGQVYRIIFESPKDETLSVSEVTVPSPPDPKPC